MIQYIEYGIGWFALFCGFASLILAFKQPYDLQIERSDINEFLAIGWLILADICFHQ